jgi:hypothetical protein
MPLLLGRTLLERFSDSPLVLIRHLTEFNPADRWTVREALDHPLLALDPRPQRLSRHQMWMQRMIVEQDAMEFSYRDASLMRREKGRGGGE